MRQFEKHEKNHKCRQSDGKDIGFSSKTNLLTSARNFISIPFLRKILSYIQGLLRFN